MHFNLLFAFFILYLPLNQVFSTQTIHQHSFDGLIYTLDKDHSLLDFTARHRGFGRVRGTFNDYRASMYYVENDLESSSVSAVIEVNSLDTQNPGRDEHIKKEFFQVEKYPKIYFSSTQIKKAGEAFVMLGKLTIKDVTRQVTLPLSVLTLNAVDQWENKRIVLETSLIINRRDFNVVYDNAFWDAIVSDEIKIDISFGGEHYNARNSIFPWRKNAIGTLIKNEVADKGVDPTLKKVRTLWQESSEDYDFSIGHFYRAGLALAQGGQKSEGIAVLELAIELHRDSTEPADIGDLYSTVAEIYAGNQQPKQAMKAVQKALEIAPSNPSALEIKRQLDKK